MRFLIIGSFKHDAKTQLKPWSTAIRQTVESCTEISDTNNDYIEITDTKQLDRYLIDRDRTLKASDSKAFDLIDVVYIIADHCRLPWSTSNKKVSYT